jgi:hypothetical protein
VIYVETYCVVFFFIEVDEEQNTRFSSEKLEKLGWTFRPMEETLRDSFESYIGLGILT